MASNYGPLHPSRTRGAQRRARSALLRAMGDIEDQSVRGPDGEELHYNSHLGTWTHGGEDIGDKEQYVKTVLLP